MSLPALYHAHHAAYAEDLDFWRELASRRGGPVLELGCGTGRVLLPLAEAGFTAFGLDSDRRMLAYLRATLIARPGLPVHVFQADLADFHLAAEFPLVLLPCNTFSTLNPAQRGGLWACLRRHLAHGGLFAASAPNPALLRSLPEESEPEVEAVFPHPVSGNPVQASSLWRRQGEGVEVRWSYDHLLPDGRVERLEVSAFHWIASLDAYRAELEAAGLSLAAAHGDFEGRRYTPQSPHLILMVSSG